MYIIKDKDVVYFSELSVFYADACKIDTGAVFAEDNTLIWRAPNDDNIMIMVSGHSIVTDILRYDSDFFSGELTYDRIVAEFKPKLKDLFASFGKIDKNGNMPNSFALAQNNRAFIITGAFELEEVYDFASYSYDRSIVKSTLRLSPGQAVDDRLRLIKQVIEADDPGQKVCLTVMNNKTFTPYYI